MKKYLGFIFCLVILTTYSCVSSSPSTYRGSLSDAMGKASNNYSGSRMVPSYENKTYDYDTIPWLWNYSTTIPPLAQNETTESKQKERKNESSSHSNFKPWFGFRVSKSLYATPLDTPGYGDIYFSSGEPGEKVEFGFYFGAGAMETKLNSQLSESISPSLFLGKIGCDFRYNIFPELDFMSPYLIITGGGFFIAWDFKNSLYDSDGIILRTDSIGGATLGAGIGVNFIRTSRFRLGIAAIPEIYLMGQYTANGFYNDYFPPIGGINIAIEASFSF